MFNSYNMPAVNYYETVQEDERFYNEYDGFETEEDQEEYSLIENLYETSL